MGGNVSFSGGAFYDPEGGEITPERLDSAGIGQIPSDGVIPAPSAILPPVSRREPERVAGNLYRHVMDLFGGMDVRVGDSPVSSEFEYYTVEGNPIAILDMYGQAGDIALSVGGFDGSLFLAEGVDLERMGFVPDSPEDMAVIDGLGTLSVLAYDSSGENGEYESALVTVDYLDRLALYLAWIRAAFVQVNDPEASGPKAETIAPIKVGRPITTHALPMNTLDKLIDALFVGGGEVVVSPRSGRSKEEYRLSMVPAKVSSYFGAGGNPEHLKCIIDTVHTLMSDRRAAAYESDGRVWFTVRTIVEEIRRTSGGTVEGRKFPNDVELTDAGLLALSGMQMTGYARNGDPTNVMYMINAERLAKVTHNGRTFQDVWGFSKDRYTLGDYAREIGQQYAYPLLDSDKPMTLEEAAARRYLLDVLNQIRHRLYTVTRTGDAKRRNVDQFTITRSWDGIFSQFKPLAKLRPEQKQKIVNVFQGVLTRLADMDRAGKLRKGMPLYIEAHSTRNGNRGGGGGAWDQLVITGHTHLDAGLKIDIGGKAAKPRRKTAKKPPK